MTRVLEIKVTWPPPGYLRRSLAIVIPFQQERAMQINRIWVLCLFPFCFPLSAFAEGIIYQLPDDGAWTSFNVSGRGIAPDGTVTVTIEGTQTLRSVGRSAVDNKQCRWIEIESEMTFQRKGGPPAAFKEIIKVLVPEAHLVKGENPRGHVIKAYKGNAAETIRELNLKGKDAREIQSLDELFHSPLKLVSALAVSEIKTEKQTWKCDGFTGKSDEDGTVFTTDTRTNKEAPFGVVTYRYEKDRQRNNKSQGKRTMEWRLVDFGNDATSAAPSAK
jgi:hypothetical protein